MRLLTRSDFDGLACAVLLKELGVIDSWKFVHPKDLQEGTVEVTDNDVLANVPYVKGCKMWFDHHLSEGERLNWEAEYEGDSALTDSAARVVFNYYDGIDRLAHLEDFVTAVDKVDSAKLTREEILNPTGWVLLGFIMDPRTGLGRFRDFRISNYDLMSKLITACAELSIEEILADFDVKERTDLYFEQDKLFREMLINHTRVDGNVIITDLRGVETIYTGNRFVIYSLFPEQNVSMWIVDGREKRNCSIAVGHSILNRTCKTNVGSLMLTYEGGGHQAVGTCQVPYAEADAIIKEIINALKFDEETGHNYK